MLSKKCGKWTGTITRPHFARVRVRVRVRVRLGFRVGLGLG